MLALLGTSLGKYLAGGLALLLIVGSIAIYVLNLRAEVSDAQAQIAAKEATINELQATNAANVKALHDLQAADALAQASLALDALHQQTIVQSVAQVQERVAHVTVPSTVCRVADARDIATLAGVRQLIGAAPPDPKPDDPRPAASGSHR
jgi:glutamate-1-semialdehyde aminotransferase